MEEPFGHPPKEYNYRCSVCGTELLVNEAIIDAGDRDGEIQQGIL